MKQPIPDRDLEREASALGSREADALDLDRVADRVVARLRSGERAASRVRVWRWLTGVAAAAVLLVATARWIDPDESVGEMAATVATAPELESLSGDELAEVLDSLFLHAPVTELVAVSLDDLNERQLAELLTLMEG